VPRHGDGSHVGTLPMTTGTEEEQLQTLALPIAGLASVAGQPPVAVGVGGHLLPEVRLVEDWVPVEVEAQLLALLRMRLPRDFVQLRGKRTAKYGGDPGPDFVPESLPPFLAQLCTALAAALHADDGGTATAASLPLRPNHVLVNHYGPGDGIMPHKDGPAYHPLAAILSLGSAVVFDFWRNHSHVASNEPAVLSLLVPPRSLLVFSDAAYSSHLHGIADRRYDTLGDDVANWTPEGFARWVLASSSGDEGSAWGRRQLEPPTRATGNDAVDASALEALAGDAQDANAGEEGYQRYAPVGYSLRREERFSLTIRHALQLHGTDGTGSGGEPRTQ